VYRKAGQDTQAREVAIARRADLRRYGKLNPYRRFGNWFLDWTIKYGYQTWRAGVGLAVVFLIFWVFSCLAQRDHLMVPVGETEGLHSLPSATKCTSSYPCFYPFGYTIDTVIPLIDVHQAAYWGPDGHRPLGHAWVTDTPGRRPRRAGHWPHCSSLATPEYGRIDAIPGPGDSSRRWPPAGSSTVVLSPWPGDDPSGLTSCS
jgi:hypothetical protein